MRHGPSTIRVRLNRTFIILGRYEKNFDSLMTASIHTSHSLLFRVVDLFQRHIAKNTLYYIIVIHF